MVTNSQNKVNRKGNKSQALSRYFIKKILLDREGGRCADCCKRKDKVRLTRINKNGEKPAIDDYILLCYSCIITRQTKREEERKKKRLWTREGNSKTEGTSKETFLNSIRQRVFKRDGHKCVFCESEERLGLTSLIPPSRGGERSIDNYVTCCQGCRCSKSNKLPLEWIFENINFECWMGEQFDDGITVSAPGVVRLDLYLIAEISRFFMKIITDDSIKAEVRNKAERLHIKLTESSEDKARERRIQPW